MNYLVEMRQPIELNILSGLFKVLSQPICYRYFIVSLVAFVRLCIFLPFCLFLSGPDPTTSLFSSVIYNVHNIKYSITCSLVTHIVMVLFTSREPGELDVTCGLPFQNSHV